MREGIIRLTEEQINSNYYKIEEVFHSQYDFMELNALRDEICRCIVCGFSQAALTLTNTLLELTTISVVDRAQKLNIYMDTTMIDKKQYGSSDSNLGYRIEMLYYGRIITESQREDLHKCRIWLRNTFSHADLKSVGKEKMPIEILNLDEQTKTDCTKSLLDLPMLKGIAFQMSAEENYINYFLYVDNFIRYVELKLQNYGS